MTPGYSVPEAVTFEPMIVRTVQRHQAAIEVDGRTGEVLGWKGLNEDADRCPGEWCGSCPTNCTCAPCRCPECIVRDASARERVAAGPRVVIVR